MRLRNIGTRMNSGSGGVLAEHNPATMQPELTEPVVPITLRTLDCRSGSFARVTSSKAPIGWEVVQLVGLQTLDLAILVRVQASQPIFSFSVNDLAFPRIPFSR